MRVLLLLLVPIMGYSQFAGTLIYKSKEVHSIIYINDSTTVWNIDTIGYSVPFEIKITSSTIAIDGYGTYKVSTWKDKSHEGTKIDYWDLTNGTNLVKIESLMYWNYPTINHKSKIIFFKIEN